MYNCKIISQSFFQRILFSSYLYFTIYYINLQRFKCFLEFVISYLQNLEISDIIESTSKILWRCFYEPVCMVCSSRRRRRPSLRRGVFLGWKLGTASIRPLKSDQILNFQIEVWPFFNSSKKRYIPYTLHINQICWLLHMVHASKALELRNQ